MFFFAFFFLVSFRFFPQLPPLRLLGPPFALVTVLREMRKVLGSFFHLLHHVCTTADVVHLNNARRVGGDTGPQVGALLRHRAGDTGSLHLSLDVHNHSGVVLEVDEVTILPAVVLALADHHSLCKRGEIDI